MQNSGVCSFPAFKPKRSASSALMGKWSAHHHIIIIRVIKVKEEGNKEKGI